jgi:hypothetical protein
VAAAAGGAKLDVVLAAGGQAEEVVSPSSKGDAPASKTGSSSKTGPTSKTGSASKPGPGTAAPPAGTTRPAGVVAGIWTSPAELAARPTTGAAWTALKRAADGSAAAAIADQDSDHDLQTMAAALVYSRTGAGAYRDKAAAGIAAAMGTEAGGRTLALGRNLPGYVIAADLIGLGGYDAWGWSDRALLRAATYLRNLDAQFGGWWATADDTWQPFLLNKAYAGAGLPQAGTGSMGKNMAFTDWTLAG